MISKEAIQRAIEGLRFAKLLCDSDELKDDFEKRAAALDPLGDKIASGEYVVVPKVPSDSAFSHAEGYCDFTMPEGFENTKASRTAELKTAYGVIIECAMLEAANESPQREAEPHA